MEHKTPNKLRQHAINKTSSISMIGMDTKNITYIELMSKLK